MSWFSQTAQRHQLIVVDPRADFFILSPAIDKELIHEAIMVWFEKGLPAIYARQSAENTDRINLGLSLILNHKKYRVALTVPASSILEQQALPNLLDMNDFFCHFYGIDGLITSLDDLTKRYEELSPMNFISVYGSFLFHYLSGEAYVNEHSDLDLLISYPGCSLLTLNGLMAHLSKKMKRTIDGEIRFNSLGDIAIKEVLDVSAKKVLIKNQEGVDLLSRAELYEYYPSLSEY